MLTKRRKIQAALASAAAAAAILLISGVVLAQGPFGPPPGQGRGPGMGGPGHLPPVPFGLYDDDGDGEVSRTEAEKPRIAKEDFEQLDADGNGSLSPEEVFPGAGGPGMRPGGGDCGGGPGGRFRSFGGPGARQGMRRPVNMHSAAGGDRGPRGRAGAPSGFAAVDADEDGGVTRKEAWAMPWMNAQRFSALDKDGDGKLSREELRGPR